MARLAAAREGLDDDHTAAAAGTWPRQHARLVGFWRGLGYLGLLWAGWDGEQVACACDVGSTVAIGEQSVVADAMEAVRQDMDEEAAASWAARSFCRSSRRNRSERTCTGRRNFERLDSQRLPSKAMPPPGTIMWTCGWWVMVEPQVCRMAVMPMRAPRCLGSAAIVSTVSEEALNNRS